MPDNNLGCVGNTLHKTGNSLVSPPPVPESSKALGEQATATLRKESVSYSEVKIELFHYTKPEKNPLPTTEKPNKADKRKVVILDADDEYEVDTSMLDKGCKVVEKRNKDGSSTTRYDFNQDGSVDLEVIRMAKKEYNNNGLPVASPILQIDKQDDKGKPPENNNTEQKPFFSVLSSILFPKNPFLSALRKFHTGLFEFYTPKVDFRQRFIDFFRFKSN